MSDAVAGAMLARSLVVVGVCANATVASNAEPITPAVIYFTDIWFLPDMKSMQEKPATASAVPSAGHIRARDLGDLSSSTELRRRHARDAGLSFRRSEFQARDQKPPPPQYGGI